MTLIIELKQVKASINKVKDRKIQSTDIVRHTYRQRERERERKGIRGRETKRHTQRWKRIEEHQSDGLEKRCREREGNINKISVGILFKRYSGRMGRGGRYVRGSLIHGPLYVGHRTCGLRTMTWRENPINLS